MAISILEARFSAFYGVKVLPVIHRDLLKERDSSSWHRTVETETLNARTFMEPIAYASALMRRLLCSPSMSRGGLTLSHNDLAIILQ